MSLLTSDEPSTLTKKGAVTRNALLSSTISMIASIGYAATTTQVVLDNSGISRGSLLHQFKTREILMVAAAEEAMDRIVVSIQSKIAKIDNPMDVLAAYPDVLWKVQNHAPARALAEIQLASCWDKQLQNGLRRAVSSMNRRIASELRIFAVEHNLRNIDKLIVEINALISATQSLAISKNLIENKRTIEDIIIVLKGHYNSALEQCTPA